MICQVNHEALRQMQITLRTQSCIHPRIVKSAKQTAPTSILTPLDDSRVSPDREAELTISLRAQRSLSQLP